MSEKFKDTPLRADIAKYVVAAFHAYTGPLDSTRKHFQTQIDENSKVAVAQADSLIKELGK